MVIVVTGCGGSSNGSREAAGQGTEIQPYVLAVPKGFPAPTIPSTNPMTLAKVELGRHLFYDRQLSINETKSCADCHLQSRAFTEDAKTSIGITELEIHARNAMSLTNVIYNAGFNWANPNTLSLEDQAFGVLFNETPVELGWSDNESVILDRFRHSGVYQTLFSNAFPDIEDPFTVEQVTQAIATFERTLISGNSDFDKHSQGDDVLSDSAKRGSDLFFSERLECFHCHGGFNFSQSVDHEGLAFQQLEFHNNGLYNLNQQGGYPLDNTGLWEFTAVDSDMGRFRAPSLRNIALTSPYMHDGSIATLREVVVDHYARGGRLITEGEHAGDGSKNPFKSSLLAGFVLTEQETEDLLAFFESLTDWTLVCNPDLSDPFGNIVMHEACAQ